MGDGYCQDGVHSVQEQLELFLRDNLKKKISLPKIEFQVIPKCFMVSVQFLILFIECIL